MKHTSFAHGKYSERGKVKDRTYMESERQNGFPFAVASLAFSLSGGAQSGSALCVRLQLLFLKVYSFINAWLHSLKSENRKAQGKSQSREL